MTAFDEAVRLIEPAKRVMVTCHLGPDGDAAGSMSAITALLRAHGREVVIYNPDGVPRTLRFLPHIDRQVHKLRPGHRFDLTIVLDCGSKKLLGEDFPPREVTGPLLVFDHHASVEPFGDLYVGDPTAACVGVLVARLAKHLGWELPRDAGPGLYTSLVADTGSFRYANTDAEALRLAADLVEHLGVDPWHVAEELGERASLARYKLLATTLGSMEITCGGRVAVMTLTEEVVRGAGATWEETEGFVNYARALDGVECGVLLSTAKPTGTRVSLRSKGRRIDAGRVCQRFGGGGHKGAAGCKIDAPLAEAKARILEALEGALG
jgi:phosphoesterase RecJ-like protein